MVTNTLTEGFTRERVKNRMLRRAAELWGYAETDLDSFDPLVTLLIEACAVEFERVTVEQGNAESRLLSRLAQILHPEPDVARPAFGVAQARPVEPRLTLPVATQLYHKRVSTSRSDSGAPPMGQEVYVSPVSPVPLIDGAVRYIATTETLFRVDEANQKIPVAQRQGGPDIGAYQPLWLGLELDESVDSLTGISFFFDGPAEAGQTDYAALLARSCWQLAGQALTLRAGLSDSGTSAQVGSLLADEFDGMRQVEKIALSACAPHFATVEAAPTLQSPGIERQIHPAVFGSWFAERDLRGLRDPVWWIEIQLPHNAMSSQTLAGLFCGINCFPVLNRRLSRITYRLQQSLNIIPLETERLFLAIRDVRTDQNRRLTDMPLGNLADTDADSYQVQYGVNRFDDRDARQALINLQDLLRDESAAFAALGEDFLSSVIRELNQSLARLEAKVDQKTHKRDSVPYLIVKTKQPGDTVFIEYWTCDGEAANRLSAGSKLIPYADNTLRKESGWLVKTTTGGRERLAESAKIVNYKRALLTRNRVVTPEDVRAVCWAELGGHLRAVTVERTFRVSSASTSGFERCIQVSLQPAATSSYSPADWEQQAKLLQLRLAAQSIAGLPYQVIVVTA